MSATNTIYYTLNGVDPRVYGSGAVSPFAQVYTGAVPLNQSAVVKARMLAGTNWSALNEAAFTVGTLTVPLAITEIMYNPIGGDAFLQVESVQVGKVDVEDETPRHVHAWPREELRRGGERFASKPDGVDQELQRFAHRDVVVDDEYDRRELRR